MRPTKRPKSSFTNVNHPIPEDVAEGFRRFREEESAALGRSHEIAELARPTKNERRSITEVYGRAFNVDVDHLTEIRGIGRKYTTRVREASEQLLNKHYFFDREIPKLDPQPIAPKPRDPSFWWANTHWYSSHGVIASFEPHGLQFVGGFTRDDQDLLLVSFGAVATFELQQDRIPDSTSGRWTSAPHVELFGGVRAFTDAGNFWTGDCWSKCSMFRRQTILQFGGFGQSGPAAVVRGHAEQEESLVNEENAQRHFSRPMPGFQWMPPVVFGGLSKVESLWAELEVRFDIQLEGISYLYIDPAILLRTFQWPVVAE